MQLIQRSTSNLEAMAGTEIFGVIVVASDGRHILTDCRGSKLTAFHTLEPNSVRHLDSCSSQQYRSLVCGWLGIQGNTHIVQQRAFYGNDELNLTVLELSSALNCASEAYQWRECNNLVQLFHVILPQQIVQFMRDLLCRRCDEDFMSQSRPWFCIGYYNRIHPWIERFVCEAGHELTEMPKQLRTTSNSTIYIVPVVGEQLYFKVCPRKCGESRRTLTLASLFPEHTDRIVRISVEHEAILMYSHGESEAVDPCETMVQWATIQQRSVKHVADLISGGLPVHNANWLRTGLDRLVHFVADHPDLISKLNLATSFVEEVALLWDKSGAWGFSRWKRVTAKRWQKSLVL